LPLWQWQLNRRSAHFGLVYSLGQHTRAVVGGSHPTPSDNSELDGFVPCLFSHLIPIQKFCRPEENLFNLANLHPSETRSMVDLTEIEKQTLRKTLVVAHRATHPAGFAARSDGN